MNRIEHPKCLRVGRCMYAYMYFYNIILHVIQDNYIGAAVCE